MRVVLTGATGNAGTAAEPHLQNVAIADLDRLADFALEEKVSLTVVGPEAALAAGAVDKFRARGLRIFGPTRAAAQLESSKAFAKAFMKRHAIPTAGYAVFEDAAAAHALHPRGRHEHARAGRPPPPRRPVAQRAHTDHPRRARRGDRRRVRRPVARR